MPNLLVYGQYSLHCPSMSRHKFLCMDCGIDTGKIRELYYLKDPVWKLAHSPSIGMLCVACVEARLGRPLCADDFTDAYINDPKFWEMSSRLLERLRAKC